MHAQPHEAHVDIRLTEAEAIALHYYRAAHRHGWTALVQAIADALADLDAAEQHAVDQGRLVSHGYARPFKRLRRCRSSATSPATDWPSTALPVADTAATASTA